MFKFKFNEFDIKSFDYLDLKIKFSQFDKFDSNYKKYYSTTHEILYIKCRIEDMDDCLDEIGYQCKISYFNKIIHALKLLKSVIKLELKDKILYKNYTDDYLHLMYNFDSYSDTLLVFYKLNYKKYNNPNTLWNLSTKRIIDNYLNLSIDCRFGYSIPPNINKIIQTNIDENIKFLNQFDKEENKEGVYYTVESELDLILSEKLYKNYNDYFESVDLYF